MLASCSQERGHKEKKKTTNEGKPLIFVRMYFTNQGMSQLKGIHKAKAF